MSATKHKINTHGMYASLMQPWVSTILWSQYGSILTCEDVAVEEYAFLACRHIVGEELDYLNMLWRGRLLFCWPENWFYRVIDWTLWYKILLMQGYGAVEHPGGQHTSPP